MSGIVDRVTRLVRDERGNVGVIFALTFIPVLGMVGLAVDYGKAVTAKTQLQNAADTAALAAVRADAGSESDRIAAAQKVFAANYKPYGGASITPSVIFSGSSVTVTASDSVPTAFSGLVGQSQFSIEAQSGASMLAGKHLELSMMIDLTGSMGERRNGVTKLQGLKDAAEDLLDILFPNGATSSDAVRVAIAPFADYVNAGDYAALATGLPSTGGSYANINNLASTRQGRFIGQYTGAIMNTAGSQCGATPPTMTYVGQTTAAGATYSNGYCSTPTVTTTVSIQKYNGYNIGQVVSLNTYGGSYNGNAPTGMIKASTANVYDLANYNYYGWSVYSSRYTSGYYVPLVSSASGLTPQSRSAWAGSSYGTKNGNVGVSLSYDNNPPSPALRASTSPSGGYWRVTSINNDGSLNYTWTTSGYYLPMYTSLGGTSTVPGCESTVSTQPSSKLISCVTERTGAQAYTDASPISAPVGRYNAGNNTVDNYSSDGECWVAGRALPEIVPLTSSRSTLDSFFTNATAGGATPGHIGTAWAWYMLSPEWNSVWPAASQPVAYGTTNVMKVAVLMTDGEYNIHYASETARNQALNLCQAMKDKGITVYTVGFGFAEGTVASSTGTTEQRAKDLLQRCASNTSTYFFPYDGDQLRRDFKAIGAQLMGDMQSDTAKLNN